MGGGRGESTVHMCAWALPWSRRRHLHAGSAARCLRRLRLYTCEAPYGPNLTCRVLLQWFVELQVGLLSLLRLGNGILETG